MSVDENAVEATQRVAKALWKTSESTTRAIIGEYIARAKIKQSAKASEQPVGLSPDAPKENCPLCGSANLDCEDDAPAYHVFCNGCKTHFDGEGGFGFFDRRPTKREVSGEWLYAYRQHGFRDDR